LLRRAGEEYVRDYAFYFAGAMVYYALLSLVPLLVLTLAALGWILRLSAVAAAARESLLRTVETSFGAELGATLQQLLAQLERGSPAATLFGLTVLLLTASALFHHLRMTFRAIWKRAPPLAAGSMLGVVREIFTERAIAFSMILGGSALLLAIVAAIATVQWLVSLAGSRPVLGDTLSWLFAALGSLLLAPLVFALLYKALAPVRLRWRDVWLAAVLTGLAWTFGAEILALYVAYSAARFSAYGAIGGILILMLWMHTVSKLLFFGAELCKVSSSERSGIAYAAEHP
jgi:membrane protein